MTVANVGDDVERNESIKINSFQDRAKHKILNRKSRK